MVSGRYSEVPDGVTDMIETIEDVASLLNISDTTEHSNNLDFIPKGKLEESGGTQGSITNDIIGTDASLDESPNDVVTIRVAA
jgi:hypothetical protein